MYFSLPYGEDILPSSVEASCGPSAHLQINLSVTKFSGGVISWVHSSNGTISPSPSEGTHYHPHSICSATSVSIPTGFPQRIFPFKLRKSY